MSLPVLGHLPVVRNLPVIGDRRARGERGSFVDGVKDGVSHALVHSAIDAIVRFAPGLPFAPFLQSTLGGSVSAGFVASLAGIR
jgi:hypothetical protein